MTAVPSLRAFTLPPSTLATSESDDAHVTVLSGALSGFTVAVRVNSSSTLTVTSEALSSTQASSVTVTLHSPFTPLAAVAVIVASPEATPVTTPSAVTVATFSSEEAYVRVLFSAFSGATNATRENVCPSSIVFAEGSSLTLSTFISAALTVTLQMALTLGCFLSVT